MIKPLAGKKVMVTREASQALPFTHLLKGEGATCFQVPLLCFEAIKNEEIKNRLIKILNETDWLFFTSANTVRFFDNYRKELQLPVTQKIAAVGEKTAETLEGLNYTVHFQPTIYSGEIMVKEFLASHGKPLIGLICGDHARKEIPNLLTEASVSFEKAVIYRTIKNRLEKDNLLKVAPLVDAVFFTSPSTVQAFLNFLPAEIVTELKASLVTVAIGDTTATTLEKNSFAHVISPKTFTIEHMVTTYVDYVNTSGKGD